MSINHCYFYDTMKILIISSFENFLPGGVFKTVTETAKNLAKAGHEVIVLQSNPFDLPEEEIYNGFKIIRVHSMFEKYLYGFSPELYKYLKNHFEDINPDIVHVHGYHTLFSPESFFSIKKINSKVPIIFSPHFGALSRNTFFGKYFGWLYNILIGKKMMRSSDIIIAASIFESDNIKKIFQLPKKKIKIIPHGVAFIDIKEKNKAEEINLLYVGYLLELKGVQYIIRTIHDLIFKKKAKVFLRVVGEGPYEEYLNKLAKQLNVNKFIKWEGFIRPESNNLFDFYRKSDILLLLSKSENYGIVVAESLALGTPVIVTKTTALNEFLDDKSCFGVDYPPNPSMVADIILKIHNSDIEFTSSKSKVKEWKEISEEYETCYDAMLKN